MLQFLFKNIKEFQDELLETKINQLLFIDVFKMALQQSRWIIARILIENIDINIDQIIFENKITPLHLAAKHGQVELVENFVLKTTLVDALDNNGETALQYAADRGHIDAACTLFAASSNSKSEEIIGRLKPKLKL